jgi:hypothetical protein
MVAPSFRTIIGVAKEVSGLLPLAPTNFLPITGPKLMAKPMYIEDKGLRGSAVETYDYILGVTHGEIDFGGPVYADTFGFLLASVLPDVVTVGGSAPYAHTLASKNSTDGQPKTYTVTDFDGVQTIAYPGAKFSDLSLKFTADGLLEYTAKAMALRPRPTRSVADGVTNSTTLVTSVTAAFTQADVGSLISGTGITAGTTIAVVVSATNITLSATATATGSGVALTIGVPAPTASYGALHAFAGWQPTITIGGSARTATNVLLDAQIDIKRTVSVVSGATGSNTPLFVWSGPLSVSGKLTFVYDDATDFNNVLNNTAPSLVLDFTAGAGAGLTEVKLQMTNASFTDATADRGGDFVKASVSFTARANTTDIGASAGYSPIKAVLQNALPTGTYV